MFVTLATGYHECEPYFSNYLKLDIGISIFAAIFMMVEARFEECEYTLIGM